MENLSALYAAMRASEMNDWVGGSDPELVGEACYAIVARLVALNPDAKVLDFGCGIGRVMASLIRHNPAIEHVVGMDIMPPVISFCNSEIKSRFPYTKFELIEGENDHYNQFITESNAKSREEISLEYEGFFSAVYAFSVFTHVEKNDYAQLLKSIAHIVQPGGEILITTFVLDHYSRDMISKQQTIFLLNNYAYEEDNSILIGNIDDRLAFIAFDRALIEKMVWDAGLVITKIENGNWMGGGLGSGLQDVIVCRKPHPLVALEDIQFTPTVARN